MIFWVEMQKARRRHDLLLCLLVPLIILLWVGGLSPESEEELANGYSALFYSLRSFIRFCCLWQWRRWPARLWDMEVKGGTMKLLYTLQSRRSLLMGKAVFGLLETALMTAIEMGAAALLAKFMATRKRFRPHSLSIWRSAHLRWKRCCFFPNCC